MGKINPIEAVARALYCASEAVVPCPENKAHLDYWFSDHPTNAGDDCVREEMEAWARAALTALSENITPEMVEAGRDAPLVALGNGQYRDPHPADVFRAMLNQAVKKQGQ